MPSTNKTFQELSPIPDGETKNPEVFYLPSTNEIFENYDDYFERMIQLNSSCWSCTMTGNTGITCEEELNPVTNAFTSKTGINKSEIYRKKIIEQQKELRPLFETAENHGVENIERWRQTFQFLSNEDIQELRNAISVAKSDEKTALCKQRIEERRKQRELLAEWNKLREIDSNSPQGQSNNNIGIELLVVFCLSTLIGAFVEFFGLPFLLAKMII